MGAMRMEVVARGEKREKRGEPGPGPEERQPLKRGAGCRSGGAWETRQCEGA